MDANDKLTGVGVSRPLDAEAEAEITLVLAPDFTVQSAAFRVSGGGRLADCAEALCGQLEGHDVRDLFQMTNNVIYYNVEPDLTRADLWQASVCVLAAKRAAADVCRKNGLKFETECDCV
ncbi:MAG: hypothetical protein IK104_08160 [Clostridia bacterium]|nr:hypothetical protein [Clostridia bacterium]